MRCLNRQRANIVFGHIFQYQKLLDPKDVSQRERVFERDGVLRWVDDRAIGHCTFGVSLGVLLSHMGKYHKRTGSMNIQTSRLTDLTDMFADEGYILWSTDPDCEMLIVLKEGCTPIDQLKAWVHALLLARNMQSWARKGKQDSDEAYSTLIAELRRTLGNVRETFDKYADLLGHHGWDLNMAALETRTGPRVQIGRRHMKK